MDGVTKHLFKFFQLYNVNGNIEENFLSYITLSLYDITGSTLGSEPQMKRL